MSWGHALRLSLALSVAAGMVPAGAGSLPGFAGGDTAYLRGLAAEVGTATNLVFVNREAEQNRCALALADATGAPLGPPIALTLRPGEERPFLDVFGAAASRPSGRTSGTTRSGWLSGQTQSQHGA